ncbi:MAG TPA: alpha/beta hydrolase [Verrucomicrobiae bacterium]|jgi:acetyl esterase/lipase
MKATSFLLILAATLAALVTTAAEKKADRPKGERVKAESVHLVEADLKTAEHVFKKTPQGELKLHFHFPPGWNADDKRPAILFFFGGAWKHGTALQFLPQAEYLATRGLVTVRADYRIESQHHTTPDKCIEDAKSAMRWLRAHAAQFGVDPQKIISSGGSAGGHLAAALALVPGFDSPDDDLKVSCMPNAMVLFNPALDFPDHGVKDEKGENLSAKFWPTPFLKKGVPPAIIFFGTSDQMAPQGREYIGKSAGVGSRAELWMAADMPHGFFNRQPWTSATVIQADRFLASLGYLKGEPTLKPADEKAVLKRAE